jgi:hypothetical protein
MQYARKKPMENLVGSIRLKPVNEKAYYVSFYLYLEFVEFLFLEIFLFGKHFTYKGLDLCNLICR